jgi:hypothetical protein
MIRTFHGDLRFVRFTRKWGLDDLFDRSRQKYTRSLVHGFLSVCKYASLAEKPKVEELQMDWLRTEDLKEEKVVTAPIAIVSVLIVENNVEKWTVNLQIIPGMIVNESQFPKPVHEKANPRASRAYRLCEGFLADLGD